MVIARQIGQMRQMNQDVFCTGELGTAACYAVVCDGMGGESRECCQSY